jgi:predicted dehydrogenase
VKVNLGLIGAGRIGRTYVEVLADSDFASLAAVADTNSEAAQVLAHEIGAKAYPNHLALLDQAQVDAVIVCTPPSSHAEVVSSALERRLHVMCEKPFALSTAEASNLMGLAGSNGVVLTMASKFRYVADIVAAKRLIASGAIGDVVLLENTFASRVSMENRWNSNRAISGGGVLIDNGTHSVDIVRYVLGPMKLKTLRSCSPAVRAGSEPRSTFPGRSTKSETLTWTSTGRKARFWWDGIGRDTCQSRTMAGNHSALAIGFLSGLPRLRS